MREKYCLKHLDDTMTWDIPIIRELHVSAQGCSEGRGTV